MILLPSLNLFLIRISTCAYRKELFWSIMLTLFPYVELNILPIFILIHVNFKHSCPQ